MIVCVCNRVSDRDIARHVRSGMGFDDIQLELGVATQCGRCEGCARQVVDQCRSDHAIAELRREEPQPTIATPGADRAACQSASAWQARA